MKRLRVNRNQQKSSEVSKSQRGSTLLSKSRQKSTFFNSGRNSVHGIQADYQRPTHVLEHKGLWRRCACFYRQALIFQREGMWRLLLHMWHNPELSGVCCFRTRNSESECGKRRRTGASDPNRHLSSPLANARFAGVMTLNP